ncbi:MAG: hypothetical protein IPK34_13205 [Ramlibacter sp.]|nr:hypothetical protein [Ramlibacter sp.]
MTTRKELIEGVGARYRGSSVSERTKILDEFVAITGPPQARYVREHDDVEGLFAACTHVLGRLYRRYGFQSYARDVPLPGTSKAGMTALLVKPVEANRQPHSRCLALSCDVPMVLGEHEKWLASEVPGECPERGKEERRGLCTSGVGIRAGANGAAA